MYIEKPVILLSIFEHNEKLIPWRETGANIVLIPMIEDGDFDYDYLQAQLNKYRTYNSLKVGSLIAGSNEPEHYYQNPLNVKNHLYRSIHFLHIFTN